MKTFAFAALMATAFAIRQDEGMDQQDAQQEEEPIWSQQDKEDLIGFAIGQEIFETIDEDGDGFGTRDEIKAALKRQVEEGELSEEDAEWFGDHMDKIMEGTGFDDITWAEAEDHFNNDEEFKRELLGHYGWDDDKNDWADKKKVKKEAAGEAAWEVFGQLDLDEDGEVTREEAEAAIEWAVESGEVDGEDAEWLGEHLEKMHGGDDKITGEEAEAYFEKSKDFQDGMAEAAGWDHKKGGFSDEAWNGFAEDVLGGDVWCEEGWCCDDEECWEVPVCEDGWCCDSEECWEAEW